MRPVVVCDLLAAEDRPGGHEDQTVPFEVLDGVGVTAVVEKGHAGVERGADGLHAHLLPLAALHHGVAVVLQNLNYKSDLKVFVDLITVFFS